MQTRDDKAYRLIIGNKNWSSWSLRPWLAMKAFGVPFEEVNVPLRRTDSKALILQHSPSGKVPALKAGEVSVWDSLAIIEFVAERHAPAPFWPGDPRARAVARSIAAEMHAGFYALRREAPMEVLAQHPTPDFSDDARADIRRIVEIWRLARAAHGANGPFLFGAFSAADAMFAPVATRFKTYGVDLAAFGDDGFGLAYRDAILATPEMAEWIAGAAAEEAGRRPQGSAFN
ncbi:MAG: glutathione S-transferase family protein [Hyphomicrobiales bacterium]|nr:glutathione S-transferase family protein [Hyphomicrobiales bacterium]